MPCAPNRVLVEVCQQCHTAPPKHGAPFSLVTYADVQRDLDGKPIWHWMEQYVREGTMPLPPIHIADGDRATLLAWLQAGAPPRSDGGTCAPDASDDAAEVVLADTSTDDVADADVDDAQPDTDQPESY